MWKLLRFLKKYAAQSVCAPIFKGLEVAFELIVPIVIAAVIDKGIVLADKPYIFKMCGVLVLLAVVGLSCTLLAQYFAAKASVSFCSDIRSALFKHISKLSFSQIDGIGTPTLITRLTGDLNQVQTGVNLTLRLLIRSPFVVFGAVIMAFTVDSRAATVFAVTVPILAVIIFAVMLITIPLYKHTQQLLDKLLSKISESLLGVRVIRAFCKEREEYSEFEAANSKLCATQLRVGRISALLNPLTVVIVNLSIALLIYRGALQVDSGYLSKGQVVALYNYMTQILIELIKLANLIINIAKSIACGNRIQAVFDTQPDIVSGDTTVATPAEYAIEFDNVTFAYAKGAEPAIKNINLKIKPHETVGIIGATGSGKSTLINLIPHFYTPDSGTVSVFGKNVNSFSLDFLRGKIGLVPQNAVLFKGTVRENMRMSNPNATDEEIFAALKTAQAEDFILKKNGVLDFVVEQNGKNLSGGQRQRLNIARALVRKPEILILDDSSSALDYATDAALRTAIKNLDFPCTVIIVSQRASSLRHADKIVVLEKGSIVDVGTDNELKERCGIYREIRRTQFEEAGGESDE
ncbi:MAG: ABC transporter ATP-binding protein [Clostridia bacterium]|nr:ABC transporter ATP-binding protein [Clostridia bacterium]